MYTEEFDVDSPPTLLDESIYHQLGYAQSEHDSVDDEHIDDLAEENHDYVWYNQTLRERWKDVVRGLIREEISWDAGDERDGGWDGNRVLDAQKKESLTGVDGRDKTCPTILHRLAHDFKSEGFSELPLDTQRKVVEFLLDKHKGTTHTTDPPADPILTRAFEYQNEPFIRFIIKHFERHLPDLIDDMDSGGANCLHYIFKRHIPEAVDRWIPFPPYKQRKPPQTTLKLEDSLHFLFFLIKFAKPRSVAASDNEGNTPMHYALAYRVCRTPAKQMQELVLQLIKAGDAFDDKSIQFNKAEQSPYLYLSHSRKEFLSQHADRRSQKLTQPNSAPVSLTSKATGKEKVSSNLGLKYGPGQTKPKVEEQGSRNTKDAYQDNSKDTSMNTKAVVDFGGPPPYSNKDNASTVNQRLVPDEPQGYGLTRRKTAGPMDDPTISGKSKPLSPSQNIETGESTSTRPPQSSAGLNLARTAVTGKMPPPESPVQGQQNGRAKMTKAGKEATRQASNPVGRRPENPKQDHPICLQAAEDVHQQLKLHYIRSLSDVEAKELLYGRIASDKNLYFDATNLRGKAPKEISDLVSMLANPGGFEDTLSYVSLPVLGYVPDPMSSSSHISRSYEANQRRQRGVSGGSESKTIGRISAVAVMDKLAESGVRKVIRLTVEEDPKFPHHTDAAIERAIRGEDSMQPENHRKYPGIAVEIWDWRKCDLSTDVIRLASPKVSEVNLYWTGNQMVLRYWASNDGIPSLFRASEKCLKSVIIHWSPGCETIQRCESLLVDLKKQVERRTSEMSDGKKVQLGVTVETRRLPMGNASEAEGSSYHGLITAGDTRVPPEHGWIESMEIFRKALMTLHQRLPEEPKVALIDDGVDRANLLTYQDRVEVTGMSYWTTSMGMSLQNPSWHQSTHGHGTIMANSIIRVNPWVSLYAMRIQDEVTLGPRNNASIRIHAGSAARAIEDAVIREVDIISISWTIQDIAIQNAKSAHGEEGKAIEALRAAIGKAKKKGILIFCSASDDVKKEGTDTLPYSEARDYIFRIGAADAYGWSDKATEDQLAIDYFLPGSQVIDDFNPRVARTDELKYRDGSSVATALAAGLASLILYLTNLMEVHYHTDSRKTKKFSEYGESLRKRDGLKRAFENIITDKNFKDKKFLPVWGLFRSRADFILDKNKDLATKWDLIDELCTKLAA